MLALLFESAVRSLVLGASVWFGLKIFRLKGPQAQRITWTVVLIAVLFMPLLMQWNTVKLPGPSVVPAWVTLAAPSAGISNPAARQTAGPAAPRERNALLLRIYVSVAGAFFLRLLLGLLLTLRLVRRAERVGGVDDLRVRMSSAVRAPVTFGRTILVPSQWPAWDEVTRRAVLSHERSHIERGDFFIQLLVALHQAIFWFSPLAWWLKVRLAELAELESDDAAIRAISDRTRYAEILVDLANRQLRPSLIGVAMARPATVSRRVERILAETFVSAGLRRVRRFLLVVSIMPLVGLAAGACVKTHAQAPQPPAPPNGTPVAQAPAPPFPAAAPLRQNQQRRTSAISGGTKDAFAVITSDYKSFSGSQEDSHRAESFRNSVQGDFIWYRQDSKEYIVSDPAAVQMAKDVLKNLDAAQEELGKRQAELGTQQAKLGEQQAQLGQQQENVTVRVPDLAKAMDEMKALLANLNGKDLRQNEIGDLQARIGDLQARVGDLQARAGEQQSRIGQQQAKLGEQQARLGAQQAEVGQEQAKRAEEALAKIRAMLEEIQRNGKARPVQ